MAAAILRYVPSKGTQQPFPHISSQSFSHQTLLRPHQPSLSFLHPSPSWVSASRKLVLWTLRKIIVALSPVGSFCPQQAKTPWPFTSGCYMGSWSSTGSLCLGAWSKASFLSEESSHSCTITLAYLLWEQCQPLSHPHPYYPSHGGFFPCLVKSLFFK